MEPNIQTIVPTPNKVNKKRVAFIIAGVVIAVIIIAGAAVMGIAYLQKNNIISQVKDDLNKVIPAMATKKAATGAYPNTITDVLALSSDKVTLTGSSSFDGTSYCISGTSNTDKSIVFHINSSKSADGPQSGSCDTGADLPVPTVPGGLAVAFATSTDVKFIWATATYASGYVLQCSTDKNFTSPTVINSAETSGTCDKLKPNTAYYSRAKSINKTGESAWSLVLKISTNN